MAHHAHRPTYACLRPCRRDRPAGSDRSGGRLAGPLHGPRPWGLTGMRRGRVFQYRRWGGQAVQNRPPAGRDSLRASSENPFALRSAPCTCTEAPQQSQFQSVDRDPRGWTARFERDAIPLLDGFLPAGDEDDPATAPRPKNLLQETAAKGVSPGFHGFSRRQPNLGGWL